MERLEAGGVMADQVTTIAFFQIFLAMMILGSGGFGVWMIVERSCSRGRAARSPGAPVPWGGGSVLLCFTLWPAVSSIVVMLLRANRPIDETISPRDAIVAVSVYNGLLLVLLPVTLRLTSRSSLSDLGVRWGRIGADLGLGVAAALAITPWVYLVQFLASLIWVPTSHPLQEMLAAELRPEVVLLALLSAVVLAPAAEEFLFRRILQGWLAKRRRPDPVDEMTAESTGFGALEATKSPGSKWSIGVCRSHDRVRCLAIGASTLLFAAVHYPQWPAPIPLVVLGIGLGYLADRTGGIVAPFAMHAAFNAFSTVMLTIMLLTGTVPRAAEGSLESRPTRVQESFPPPVMPRSEIGIDESEPSEPQYVPSATSDQA